MKKSIEIEIPLEGLECVQRDDAVLYRLRPCGNHAGAFLEVKLVRGKRWAFLDFDPLKRAWAVGRFRHVEDGDLAGWTLRAQ